MFNPKILIDFGMDFCKQIVLYMNPVVQRKYLTQLIN